MLGESEDASVSDAIVDSERLIYPVRYGLVDVFSGELQGIPRSRDNDESPITCPRDRVA